MKYRILDTQTETEVASFDSAENPAAPLEVLASRTMPSGVLNNLIAVKTKSVSVWLQRSKEAVLVASHLGQLTVKVERGDRAVANGDSGTGIKDVKSSMPGKVLRMLIEAGQTVERGTAILVLEAMKMENEIKSPVSGVVTAVVVSVGQTVETGQKLFSVERNS